MMDSLYTLSDDYFVSAEPQAPMGPPTPDLTTMVGGQPADILGVSEDYTMGDSPFMQPEREMFSQLQSSTRVGQDPLIKYRSELERAGLGDIAGGASNADSIFGTEDFALFGSDPYMGEYL